MSRWIGAFLLACMLIPAVCAGDVVKKSKSGICHDTQSPYYARTIHFQPFTDLTSCLQSGGRLPRGHLGAQPQSNPQVYTAMSSRPSAPIVGALHESRYDRAHFGSWIDEDSDCLNTRHELLLKLSTSTVAHDGSPCMVRRGRWNDPYTGKIFYEARDMDVDHLVPLKWAWERGADSWSREKRVAFANDERNLFAVEASINRQKGALGPLHWLPPHTPFRCQYVLRFMRVVKIYGLAYTPAEAPAMERLRQEVCE